MIGRFGRRGTVLLLLGAMWSLQAVSETLIPNPGYRPGSLVVHHMVPSDLSVTLWLTTGIIAMVAATRMHDAFGFIALAIPAVIKASSWSLAGVIGVLPLGDAGDPAGLVGAATWASIVVLVFTVAGWAEPLHHPPLPPEVGGDE